MRATALLALVGWTGWTALYTAIVAENSADLAATVAYPLVWEMLPIALFTVGAFVAMEVIENYARRSNLLALRILDAGELGRLRQCSRCRVELNADEIDDLNTDRETNPVAAGEWVCNLCSVVWSWTGERIHLHHDTPAGHMWHAIGHRANLNH